MLTTVVFLMFSVILLLSALMVITARNPVHAVLFLILAFFNAAGLFVLLGAEFIAMILVIVYVGAVAVLFLFVVMMLDINFTNLREGVRKYVLIGGTIGGILLAELLAVYEAWQHSGFAVHKLAAPAPKESVMTNTHALGAVLYTDMVLPFQIAGLILLVAMVGAITLTHRTRPGVRRQDAGGQSARKRSEVIRIEKVTVGTGVE